MCGGKLRLHRDRQCTEGSSLWLGRQEGMMWLHFLKTTNNELLFIFILFKVFITLSLHKYLFNTHKIPGIVLVLQYSQITYSNLAYIQCSR